MMLTTLPRGIHHIRDVIGTPNTRVEEIATTVSGRPRLVWVQDIPNPYRFSFFDRLCACWWVLRNRAFVIAWPKNGEIEQALYGPVADVRPQAVERADAEEFDDGHERRKPRLPLRPADPLPPVDYAPRKRTEGEP